MPVRFNHDSQPNNIFFITFTCYQWKNLFHITNAYDAVYKWFDWLYKREIYITGFVIMPNHIHLLLYFPTMSCSLNRLVSNAKRFMAYEIIKRLERKGEKELLHFLKCGVRNRERKRGQVHKVFEESFDAKACYTVAFIYQKLQYIHYNPVSKRWQLVNDFADYKHSSAGIYEKGVKYYPGLMHINDVLR